MNKFVAIISLVCAVRGMFKIKHLACNYLSPVRAVRTYLHKCLAMYEL